MALKRRNMEPTRIEFVHEWMGNPKGSTQMVYGWAAEELAARGVAKRIDVLPEGKGEPKSGALIHLEGETGDREAGAQESKFFRNPPKDKAVKEPKKSK